MLVLTVTSPVCAAALEQNETMGQWLASSEQDRARVLDELRTKNSILRQADRAALMACMNAAAEIPMHQELRIGDVAEACSESPPGDGAPQTDI